MEEPIPINMVKSPINDTVRRVEEEGLEARNLLNFIADGLLDAPKVSRKPPSSPRPQSTSPNPLIQENGKGGDSKFQFKTNKRRLVISRPKNRLRSASAGRNPERDLRARYWTFLFENLHRAVDEIYQTCEMDESIVESKEAIMMLENYSKDFHALIQWLNISKSYEKTAPVNRPTSLAWEVRKSSPGKSMLKNVFIEKLTAGNSQAKRILCFDSACDQTLSSIQPEVNCVVNGTSKKSVSSVSQATSNQEKLCEKSEVPKKNVQSVTFIDNQCDVKISVHKSTDDLFPCSQDLIIEQVKVINEYSTLNGDSQKITTADIKEESLLIVDKNNEGDVKTNDDKSNVSFIEIEPVNPTPDEIKFDTSVETVAQNNAQSVGNCNSIEISDVSHKENEVKHSKPNTTNSSITHEEIIEKNKSNKCLKPGVVKSVKASTITNNSVVRANNETTRKNDLVNKNEKKSVGTGFNNNVTDFPKIKDTIGIKNVVPRKINVSTTKGIKSASSELLSGTLKTQSSISNTTLKSTPRKKDDISKPAEKSTIKSDTISLTKNLDLSKNLKAVSTSKSVVPSMLTRSKTCVVNSVSASNKQITENPPVPAVAMRRPISSPKPNSTLVRKNVVKTPEVPSDKKTSRATVSDLSSRRPINTPERNVIAKSSSSSSTLMKKVVPARTVSYAVKLPQKSGSLSSLHVPNRKCHSELSSSAEHIATAEVPKKDSDGWETVRGRTRSRNSPAKKVPQSTEVKTNQVAQIAKLNQARVGGFPYSTKDSKSAAGDVKVAADKKNDSSDLKLEEKKDDLKSLNQTKADSGVSELSNKKSISKISGNQTGMNQKQSVSTSGSMKVKNVDESNEVITIDTNVDESSANSQSDLSLRETINVSENFRENKLDKTRTSDFSIKSNNYNINKYDSDLAFQRALKKSSSAPSLCDIYEDTDFNFKKALSDSEQAFDESLKKSIKVYKKKISNKIFHPSKVKCFDSSDFYVCLGENNSGLASVDEYDMLSNDEAFNAQTRELYDTARKYKILEEQVHKLELSWGEQMDRLDMELRTPGRALEMHEKLSSPFRKKSLFESIRLCNEKQAKAQEQRERFLEEKAQKFKDIEKKRLEMKTLVEKRQEQQRIMMEEKLERAEKQRKKQLEIIVKKAHDEEEKVNEIAFINTLEAQNKRHDLISKEKDSEARLQDIQDERQRRQEEKAAKEAAAEERRKVLEAERQARLIEMQEKRKLKDLKIEQQFLEKEKERQELANQKARERDLRLSALNAAQQIQIEELQKKIQLKQEESARRHEENIEQIRLKAFELSVRRCSSNNDDAPQPVPYETKKICTICNVLIGSEVYLLSHLRGEKHLKTVKYQHQGQDPSTEELELYNLKHIVDASTDQLDPNIAMDKERQKASKKRCKKLRQRMSNRGLEYESQLQKTAPTPSSKPHHKVVKIVNSIKKLISTHDSGMNDGSFLNSLDRILNELEKLPSKGSKLDKSLFCSYGGIGVLVDIFKKVSSLSNENNAFVLKRIIAHTSSAVENFVGNCYENCYYSLFSNKIGCILDLLIQRLNDSIPDNFSKLISNSSKSSEITLKVDVISVNLLHFLSIMLITLSETEKAELESINSVYFLHSNNEDKEKEEFQQRIQDIISYIVSAGIIDKLTQYFNSIQGPISNEAEVAPFLLNSIAFFVSLIKLFSKSLNSSFDQKKTMEDTTQLLATFKLTNLVGAVSLLYGLLLHSGASSRGDNSPQQLPQHTINITLSALCLLNHMALANLQAFQTILGSEGLSLQLRHITSHLLWYCSHWTSDALLHEVILLIGYFTVLNPENQLIIQAGQRPTVLQQLCSLPFMYFSDSELIDILFPTLISCCFNNTSNKIILEQEMSSELLSNYIESQSLNIHQVKNKKENPMKKRWMFSMRFSKDRWSSAKQYFSVEG